MDCSLPGSSVHRISQARILEWVAISFSRGSSPLRGWNRVSCIVGRRFTVWAIREVHWSYKKKIFKFIHIYICQGNFIYVGPFGAFLVAQTAKKKKKSTSIAGRPGFDSWVRKIPWNRKWQLTPVLLPGESCGQRIVSGYSPPGHKELDVTEGLTHTQTHWALWGRLNWKRILFNAGSEFHGGKHVNQFVWSIKLL